jgi:hypothetical protein
MFREQPAERLGSGVADPASQDPAALDGNLEDLLRRCKGRAVERIRALGANTSVRDLGMVVRDLKTTREARHSSRGALHSLLFGAWALS